MGRGITGLSEETNAVLMATLRCMGRAPEIKMVFGGSLLVTLILGGSFLLNRTENIPGPARPFAVLAAVVLSTFVLLQALTNQYGFDRDGFRAFVLSPAPRRSIVLGKSVAYLAVTSVLSSIVLLATAMWLRLPFVGWLAALLQGVFIVITMNFVGSIASILFPYRIRPGSLKPTKAPGLNILVLFALQFLAPLAVSPAFLPPFGGVALAPGKLAARSGESFPVCPLGWRSVCCTGSRSTRWADC